MYDIGQFSSEPIIACIINDDLDYAERSAINLYLKSTLPRVGWPAVLLMDVNLVQRPLSKRGTIITELLRAYPATFTHPNLTEIVVALWQWNDPVNPGLLPFNQQRFGGMRVTLRPNIGDAIDYARDRVEHYTTQVRDV
jgi:hypothetical protein